MEPTQPGPGGFTQQCRGSSAPRPPGRIHERETKSLATQRHFFKVSEMDVFFSTGAIQKALRGMIHLAPAQRMFEESCKKQN